MAFVFTVEDGTGVVGANAYITVPYANDYHSGRANTAWAAAADDATRQAAIVRATDHIEQRYGSSFLGYRLLTTQSLHWPAARAWLDGVLLTGVPDLVRRACAEYALRALDAPLVPDVPAGGGVESEMLNGGMIQEQIFYKAPGQLPSFPIADRWLRLLTLGSEVQRA
jgi:hypothetical protein